MLNITKLTCWGRFFKKKFGQREAEKSNVKVKKKKAQKKFLDFAAPELIKDHSFPWCFQVQNQDLWNSFFCTKQKDSLSCPIPRSGAPKK